MKDRETEWTSENKMQQTREWRDVVRDGGRRTDWEEGNDGEEGGMEREGGKEGME